ncbi:unnamed protein product [Echinostoma caproni]|uniref:Endo/exonuclease/phosphatase domain-containing protein n=1 Tax=Echinostoma caproni TaxID=27848 RepID=A0A183B304_9TREM|nr:unnamed protein product [Echinostoma caproni]
MSEQSWLRQEQNLRAQISHLEAMLKRQSIHRPSQPTEEAYTKAQVSAVQSSAPITRPKTIGDSGPMEKESIDMVNKNTAVIIARWDIIAVTENWLTDDILRSELGLPGMSLLRRDRLTRGGGVPLYNRSDLQCDAVDPPVSAPDAIWCKLKLSKHAGCLVGVVYRSPPFTESANDTLLQAMSQFLSAKFSHILIAAGFTSDELEEALMLLRERKSKQSREDEGLEFLEKVQLSETKGTACKCLIRINLACYPLAHDSQGDCEER